MYLLNSILGDQIDVFLIKQLKCLWGVGGERSLASEALIGDGANTPQIRLFVIVM